MAKENKRETSFNEDNHVDVRNDFITNDNPDAMIEYPDSIKAIDLKLLRFVISQCRKGDKEFFEYEFSAAAIAEHMSTDKQNLYGDAIAMTEKRLFNCNLRKKLKGGKKNDHVLVHLFETCVYKNGIFTMKIDDRARELFLELQRNFTSVKIEPILSMKNKNSIRLYELIYMKLESNEPYADHNTTINVTVDEILRVTEKEAKKSYEQPGHIKSRLLLPAIKEIEVAADWKINVTNLKRSRQVVGFELDIWKRDGWEVIEKCKREGTLPPRPKYREEIPGQMSLFD